jgi:hypothetical protein
MGFLNDLISQMDFWDKEENRRQAAPRQAPAKGKMPVQRFEDGSARVGNINVPVDDGGVQQGIGRAGNFPQKNLSLYEDNPNGGIPLASQYQNVGNFQQDDINGINPQGNTFGVRGLPRLNGVNPQRFGGYNAQTSIHSGLQQGTPQMPGISLEERLRQLMMQ